MAINGSVAGSFAVTIAAGHGSRIIVDDIAEQLHVSIGSSTATSVDITSSANVLVAPAAPSVIQATSSAATSTVGLIVTIQATMYDIFGNVAYNTPNTDGFLTANGSATGDLGHFTFNLGTASLNIGDHVAETVVTSIYCPSNNAIQSTSVKILFTPGT